MLKLLPLLLTLNAAAAVAPVTFKTVRVLPEGTADATLTMLATPAETSINLWSLETGKQLGHVEIPVLPLKSKDDYNKIQIHSLRPDLNLMLVSYAHGHAGAEKYSFEKVITQFFLVSLDDEPKVKKLWSFEGPCAVSHGISRCSGFGFPNLSPSSYIFKDRPEVRLFVRKYYEGRLNDPDYAGYVNLAFDLKGKKLFENEAVYKDNKIIKGAEKFYDAGAPRIVADDQSCRVMRGDKRVSFLEGCIRRDWPEISGDGKTASSHSTAVYKAWDLETGALTLRLDSTPPEGWECRGWSASPDGRVLMANITKISGSGVQVQVWSAAGKRLGVASGPDADALGYFVATNGPRALFLQYEKKGDDSIPHSVLVDVILDGDAPAASATPAAKLDVDALPSVTSKPDPDAFAVVIGVEKYRQAGVPSVDYASRDAKTMAAYLGAMGFDAKNVAVLTDAQAGKVDFDKHFGKWLKNRVGPKSRVFVYYAGHGAPNPTTGAGYLMPYEADPSYLDETGYPVSQLYGELAKLPTKDVTVVLDACFSGQGERSLIAKGTRPLVAMQKTRGPENAAVIAAASGSQISASDHEARHGLLTYHLLAGLHGGADDNGDGKITTAELFKYAGPAVERAAKLQNVEQTPTVSGENGLAGARVWTTVKKP